MQAREAAMASPAAVIRTPVQCKQTIHTGKNSGVQAPSPTLLSASPPSSAGGNTDPVVIAQTPFCKVEGKNTTHAGANSCVYAASLYDDFSDVGDGVDSCSFDDSDDNGRLPVCPLVSVDGWNTFM